MASRLGIARRGSALVRWGTEHAPPWRQLQSQAKQLLGQVSQLPDYLASVIAQQMFAVYQYADQYLAHLQWCCDLSLDFFCSSRHYRLRQEKREDRHDGIGRNWLDVGN